MRILDFADGFESSVQPSIVGVSAGSIGVTPAGNISSANVQAALEELDSEKVKKVTSTDNAVTRFDGTTGEVQNSLVTVSDTGDMVVAGNLTVQGTSTTLNTQTLEVADKNIVVAKGGNDAAAEGAGLTVDRTSAKGSLVFDSTKLSKWKLGLVGSEVEVADISSAQSLANKSLVNPSLDIGNLTEQGTTPSTPAAGTKKLYAKTDGKLYTKDSTGTEKQVGSGAGGGGKNYLADYNDGSSIAGITSSNAGLTTAVNNSSPLRAGGNQPNGSVLVDSSYGD